MIHRTARVGALMASLASADDGRGRLLHDPDDAPAELARRVWAAGLGRHADDLARLGRRAARLVPSRRGTSTRDIRAGSRLGGDPALPIGVEWPVFRGRPQRFIAGIDLAEVAAAVPGSGLPAAGSLLFFRHDCPAWRSEHDVHPVDSAAVIVVGADEPVEVRASPVPSRACALEVVPELTHPADLPERLEALAAAAGRYDIVDHGELDELLQFADELVGRSRPAPVLRALGHASPVGRDPVGPGCSLLLQLDGAIVGPGATRSSLYWWLRDTDLAAGNWQRAMWEERAAAVGGGGDA